MRVYHSLKSYIEHNITLLCNLLVDCARELSKSLKDSASLLVCNEKNFLVSGFFVGDS